MPTDAAPPVIAAAGDPVTGVPAPGAATHAALAAYLYAIGDDEMLLGHRDAEWTGLGPILEEDIAFSSMAQDELGHARVWYGLLHDLGEPEADAIAFLRDAPAWRNAALVELPRGDYALSLMRQYLYDVAEAIRLDALGRSSFAPMAEAAVKLRQEEKYHLIHNRAYIERLARSGADSRGRLQSALDHLFPYALGLWEPPAGEDRLVAAGIAPDSLELRQAWLDTVCPFLAHCGLKPPAESTDTAAWHATVDALDGGRRGEHTEHLVPLLAAMQGLYRSDPEAVW